MNNALNGARSGILMLFIYIFFSLTLSSHARISLCMCVPSYTFSTFCGNSDSLIPSSIQKKKIAQLTVYEWRKGYENFTRFYSFFFFSSCGCCFDSFWQIVVLYSILHIIISWYVFFSPSFGSGIINNTNVTMKYIYQCSCSVHFSALECSVSLFVVYVYAMRIETPVHQIVTANGFTDHFVYIANIRAKKAGPMKVTLLMSSY